MSSRAWLLLGFATCCAAATPPLQPYESVEAHMGTLVRIKLFAHDASEAETAFRSAFARIAAIDAALTDYAPDSELNRVCKDAVRHDVRVSDDLFTVLGKSQEMAEATGGAFDVTIGPLTHLWRAARRSHEVPASEAIELARSRSGYRKLHLNQQTHAVRLDQAGMQLDLGGIAKGYAADKALDELGKHGISSAMVAASGDLAFSAAPPGERGWKIQVDAMVVALEYAAVSTSGDAEQHLDAAGRRYSHVIDPKTGSGLTNSLTVTVVAKRGIDADAADTAADVLGVEAGLAFIESQPALSALLVRGDRNPSEVLVSKRFRTLPVFTGGTH